MGMVSVYLDPSDPMHYNCGMKSSLLLGWLLLTLPGWTAENAALARSIPRPRPDHPGNIFLAGETVTIQLPVGQPGPWRVTDYDDQPVMTVLATNDRVNLGPLPLGFYRLRSDGFAPWISCGVIAPLKVPSPRTSPVAIDVALAWSYPMKKMDAVASLCALAGVNWVRDRLNWSQMEIQRGQFADPIRNPYDAAALAQSRAGLQVLQVNHYSPQWANPNSKRFPLDLRDAYRFYREMARRWQGQVLAFEPWNEADIPGFGGHTGAEMAAMQKASYLGLKVGSPDVVACLNVFATHNRSQLEDLRDNEAYACFDTYNLHCYEPFDHYPKLYADHRAVSAGKPLWVTECAVPVKWAGDEKLKEPTDADLRVQAERVAKTFACSRFEGAVEIFYFMLPHYVEGQTQFGILRPDLTPRPAMVALAAVGRLLADATPMGCLPRTNSAIRAFLFHARPDGLSREVLVAWTTAGETKLGLASAPLAIFDHLGRSRPAVRMVTITSAPMFILLPEGSAQQFALGHPPAAPPLQTGKASAIVLQALWPEEKVVLKQSAYRIFADKVTTIPLFVYNFGTMPAQGRLRIEAPSGWQARIPEPPELAPQSRTELQLELDSRSAPVRFVETIRVVGDFGSAGRTVLSQRLMPDLSGLARRSGTPLPGASEPQQWEQMISGGGPIHYTAYDGGILVEAEPKGGDRWVYPLLKLSATGRISSGTVGLACTLTLIEGEAQFRAIFDEDNGSGYVADFLTQPKHGETVETIALFENAEFGAGWSKPDPNRQLDVGQIAALKIGCNTKSARVKYAIKNVRWIQF